MTRVLVVRHGQSTWNAEHRWAGGGDPPLSELGRGEARAAAAELGPRAVWAVVTSDLLRASQTAEIIAQELGLPSPKLDCRLRERGAGEWTGLTSQEIEIRSPGQLEAWRSGRIVDPHGSESWDAFRARVLTALNEVRTGALGPRILVVAHQGVLRVIESQLGVRLSHLGSLDAIRIRSDDRNGDRDDSD